MPAAWAQFWPRNICCSQSRTRQLATLQRAHIIIALALKRRCFHGWASLSRSVARGADVLLRVASGMRAEWAEACLRHWRAGLDRSRRRCEEIDREQLRLDRDMAADCFELLRRHAAARRRHAGILAASGRTLAASLHGRAFAGLRWNLGEERLERQLDARAVSFCLRWRQAKALAAWREAAAWERRERRGLAAATGHDRLSAVRRRFSRWRAAVAEACADRARWREAGDHRLATLQGAVCAAWADYAAARRAKCREAGRRRCAEAVALSRQRRTLWSWSGAWHAAQLRQAPRVALGVADALSTFLVAELHRVLYQSGELCSLLA